MRRYGRGTGRPGARSAQGIHRLVSADLLQLEDRRARLGAAGQEADVQAVGGEGGGIEAGAGGVVRPFRSSAGADLGSVSWLSRSHLARYRSR